MRKHGHFVGNVPTRTYRAWTNMRTRCTNPNAMQYPRYGGRGIKVCERWATFANFLADMGEAQPDQSLDRIDVHGNYEPGNCRWTTPTGQARNRTSNRVIDTPRGRMCIYEAAEQWNIRPDTLTWRLENGWAIKEALYTPTNLRGKYDRNALRGVASKD